MDRDALMDERARLRDEWRRVREERLQFKAELSARGLEPERVRRQPQYRALQKEQQRLTTLLRHINIKLNRIRTGEREESDR